eukprot:CAMPEP_0170178400 /NCGR_PEP_ID=MMETSP0040_2-20121228/11862_1 /TAXON_ID=641309 /ORGANISM="Lotharella oceanica, Strain CCMP622" /LENGTH=193 /DNA_ID=CAMNT_0010421447 /DNA_START=40 /DNA_END=621 /DNA_ORIENTATION=-
MADAVVSIEMKRLLSALDKPWGGSKAAGLIDEALLDQLKAKAGELNDEQTARLLASFLHFRKDQTRNLKWKVQELIEILSEGKTVRDSWAAYLGRVVLEQYNGVDQELEADASTMIRPVEEMKGFALCEASIPHEYSFLHPSLLPAPLHESLSKKRRAHFTVAKPITFASEENPGGVSSSKAEDSKVGEKRKR